MKSREEAIGEAIEQALEETEKKMLKLVIRATFDQILENYKNKYEGSDKEIGKIAETVKSIKEELIKRGEL